MKWCLESWTCEAMWNEKNNENTKLFYLSLLYQFLQGKHLCHAKILIFFVLN